MQFFWHRAYPLDVPFDIDLDRYATLHGAMRQAIARRPDAIAFSEPGRELSYRQFGEEASALAAFMVAAFGLRQGERVALMLPNCTALPTSMLGLLEAGLVVVNVNPLYTERELAYQLRDSGARAVVMASVLLPKFSSVLQDVAIQHIVTVDVPLPVECKAAADALPEHTPYEDAIARGRNLAFVPPEIVRSAIACLQYTGGTTGPSKGAILSHANLLANVQQIDAWLGNVLKPDREVFLTALPLYHALALTFNFFYCTLIGGRSVLVANPSDYPGLVTQMRDQRITSMTGVNTLFNSLLATPGFDQIDFSALRLVVGGGAAVQAAVARRWHAATGNHITEGYGLTETSPALCMNPAPSAGFTGSVGFPLPMTELTLRDDQNRDVPIGEHGELCARGPQVMRGYWQAPEANAAAFTPDGFFRTGDIARMDDRGQFYLVDRKKDMVLVSGFSVFPSEIEGVCAEHWGVREVACIGTANRETGEAVVLYVVKSDPRLSAEELIAHCRRRLTPYKVPRRVHFVATLPKSPVGKILRRKLRDQPDLRPSHGELTAAMREAADAVRH